MLTLALLMTPMLGQTRAVAGSLNVDLTTITRQQSAQPKGSRGQADARATLQATAASTEAIFANASVSDDPGCPEEVIHGHCGTCVGGSCSGYSLAVPFTTFSQCHNEGACIRTFAEQLGLALSKPNAVFRPPRPLL
ncbi:hypothetical protein MesoLjLb_48340 [Mesorhizobium sp. L-8-3]|nr:hypothetical protein MesoLjLb_48340 [Mesorhizobium sp. L-8-3]